MDYKEQISDAIKNCTSMSISLPYKDIHRSCQIDINISGGSLHMNVDGHSQIDDMRMKPFAMAVSTLIDMIAYIFPEDVANMIMATNSHVIYKCGITKIDPQYLTCIYASVPDKNRYVIVYNENDIWTTRIHRRGDIVELPQTIYKLYKRFIPSPLYGCIVIPMIGDTIPILTRRRIWKLDTSIICVG